MSVILAIDYGEKRLGLAISDVLEMSANPLETIRSKSDEMDLEAIGKVVEQRGVELIVVGLPLNMDGSEGPMAQAARLFAGKIESLGVPVETWDERLSSRAAEASLLEANLSRKKRKGLRDKVAAAWFLQAFLDSRSR